MTFFLFNSFQKSFYINSWLLKGKKIRNKPTKGKHFERKLFRNLIAIWSSYFTPFIHIFRAFHSSTFLYRRTILVKTAKITTSRKNLSVFSFVR